WGPAVSRWITAHDMNPQEQAAAVGWVCMAVVLWAKPWRENPLPPGGGGRGWGGYSAGSPPSPPPRNLCSRSKLGHRSSDVSDLWSPIKGEGVSRRLWLALAGAGCVLALGNYLHLLPYNTWCPLPFFALRLLPVVGNVRMPERWMAMAVVGWAVILA